MRASPVLAILLALLASMLWGATGLWMHFLTSLSLSSILFFRFVLALVVIVVVMLVGKKALRSDKMTLIGGVALFLYYAFATAAFRLSNMVDVSLIISLTPAFVLAGEWIKGHPPGLMRLAGAAIAAAGSAFVILTGEHVTSVASDANAWGLMAAFCAALVMALYSFAGTSRQADASSMNFWTLAFGSVAALAYLLSNSMATQQPFIWPDSSQWSSLAALVVLSTVLAGLSYKMACEHGGASLPSVIRLSTPLFSALYAVVMLGQPLLAGQLVGVPLILLGIYLVNRK